MMIGNRKKGFSVILLFLFFLCLASGSTAVFAARNVNVQFDMEVLPIITVSFEKGVSLLRASRIQDQLDTMSVRASIRTNSPTGYTAYLSTDKKRAGRSDEKATGLVHMIDDTRFIPTLDNPVAAEDFPVNRWGYSVDGGQNYVGMNAYDDLSKTVFASQEAMENSDVDLYFATKLDDSFVSGFYENTIIVTAVANYVSETINDIEYLQEMNPEIAMNMKADQQYRLKDRRDGKEYWIAKLQDDNIWMTQDLDYREIDSEGHIDFTVDDSDTIVDATFSIKGYSKNNYSGEETLIMDSEDDGHKFINLAWLEKEMIIDGVDDGTNYGLRSDIVDAEDYHYVMGTLYGKALFNYSILGTLLGDKDMASIKDSEFDKHIAEAPASFVCPNGWRLPLYYEMNTLAYRYGVTKNNEYTNAAADLVAESAFMPIMEKITDGHTVDFQQSNVHGYMAFLQNALNQTSTSTSTYDTAPYNPRVFTFIRNPEVSRDIHYRVVGTGYIDKYASVRCVLRWQ